MAVESEKRISERKFQGWTSEPFHIPIHFKDNSGKNTRQQATPSIPESSPNGTKLKAGDVDFRTIKRAVIEYFKQRYDSNSDANEQNRWIDRKHEAVTGNAAAVEWFKKEIEDILIRSNWLNNSFPFPKAYGNIVEAVYQETYGIGPVSTWWKHPRYHESEAASIIGTKVVFELPGDDEDGIQDIYYESNEDVERIAIQLSLRNSKGSLNKHNPDLEINMEDGTRVTITIPPWTVEPIITFRHFTITQPTFSLIAEKGTLPSVIIPVLDAFSEGRLTTVIAGPVKSGKTILTKAVTAKRKKSDAILVFHKEFDETRFHEQLPSHKFKQYIITEKNMKSLFPLALRSDYEYIIVTELRSFESDLFLKSASRGLPGAVTNMHILDPYDIPAEIAELIIEEYPTKSYDALYKKAAKNIHLAYMLEELNDKSKRLNGIVLYDWDHVNQRLNTFDVMTWDEDKETWIFNNYIPKKTLKILMKYAPEATKRAISTLNRLVEQQKKEGLVNR